MNINIDVILQNLTVLPTTFFRQREITISLVKILPTNSLTECVRQ
jgi:hypothetical protein